MRGAILHGSLLLEIPSAVGPDSFTVVQDSDLLRGEEAFEDGAGRITAFLAFFVVVQLRVPVLVRQRVASSGGMLDSTGLIAVRDISACHLGRTGWDRLGVWVELDHCLAHTVLLL